MKSLNPGVAFLKIVYRRWAGVCLLALGCSLACGGTASSNENSSDGGAGFSQETGGDGIGGSTPDGAGGEAVGGTGDGDGGIVSGGTGGVAAADGGDRGAGGNEAGGAPSGGTGGLTATPGVETLGDDCDSPGTLACAGTFQNLSLLCEADGTWVANETCNGTQVCDTGAVAVGTCQEQLPECEGEEPGHEFCSDFEIRACGVDKVGSSLVSECPVGCVSGECTPTNDECITDDNTYRDCSGTCEDFSPTWCEVDEESECSFGLVLGQAVFRIPAAHDICQGPAECPGEKMFVLNTNTSGPARYKLTIPPDWSAVVLEHQNYLTIDHRSLACDAERVTGCLVLEPGETTKLAVVLIANVPNAAERNIDIEYAFEPLSCP